MGKFQMSDCFVRQATSRLGVTVPELPGEGGAQVRSSPPRFGTRARETRKRAVFLCQVKDRGCECLLGFELEEGPECRA